MGAEHPRAVEIRAEPRRFLHLVDDRDDAVGGDVGDDLPDRVGADVDGGDSAGLGIGGESVGWIVGELVG
jgi:hypothetical protein